MLKYQPSSLKYCLTKIVENMSNKEKSAYDKRIDQDERICFGIVWFASEEDAAAYDKEVRAEGRTYNGGYFHGMPCGRDKSFDHYSEDSYKPVDEHGNRFLKPESERTVIAYAVTH